MTIYSNLGGATPIDAGLTEAEALLEAKKVSGYLGLLSPYYFGGAGTATTIAPSQVNSWVDVNLTVDANGTFDYRPQDMVDADPVGFTGSGIAGSSISEVVISGDLDDTTAFNTTAVEISLPDGGYVRLKKWSGDDWLFQFSVNAIGSSGLISFDPATGVPTPSTATQTFIIDWDFSGLRVVTGPTTAALVSTDYLQPDPYLYNLAGLTQQSFGKMRVTALYNPDIDEGQLDVRLLFTPNSSGTFGQFSIAEQAATMTQGAGVEYFVEPTITFFVGNTIEDLGSGDFGKFQLQIRSSVEGEFTLRGATMYIHS